VHNLALHEPGAPPTYRSSFSRVAEPELSGGLLTWRAEALGCSITGQAGQAPFGLRLLDRADGTVDWQCQACPARMQVMMSDGTALSGPGYAERLTLSLPPWRLPIDELRWGRWIAADGGRSIVWIDWRGVHPLTAVFLDGVRQGIATVDDDRVAADDVVLNMADQRTLHRRALRDVIGAAGPLARVFPAAWLDVEDCKWMSVGTLQGAGARPETGWAIHEHVRFP
jgi:hypothetical protein